MHWCAHKLALVQTIRQTVTLMLRFAKISDGYPPAASLPTRYRPVYFFLVFVCLLFSYLPDLSVHTCRGTYRFGFITCFRLLALQPKP